MTRKQYVAELATKITDHGYWSNEVLECNTLGQQLFNYSVWQLLHDKAKYISNEKLKNNYRYSK
jgi:hypothetical protein